MKPAKKKRLILISSIFFVATGAIGLVLYAMRGDLNHYYSLEQISKGEAPINQNGIRVGGMVAKDSLKRQGDTLTVHFNITDHRHQPLPVSYTGILPDLFREGQGVIARGEFKSDGTFYATQILAKHDENYMPPEVKADMQKSGFNHSNLKQE